jgi:hypothetical protein
MNIFKWAGLGLVAVGTTRDLRGCLLLFGIVFLFSYLDAKKEDK